jgi:hypothetical protein
MWPKQGWIVEVYKQVKGLCKDDINVKLEFVWVFIWSRYIIVIDKQVEISRTNDI